MSPQDLHDAVQMVAHLGGTPDRHAEDTGQLVNAILHPLPTVFERTPRQPILTSPLGHLPSVGKVPEDL